MSPCKGGNCPEPVWCEQEGECLWDRWNKPAASPTSNPIIVTTLADALTVIAIRERKIERLTHELAVQKMIEDAMTDCIEPREGQTFEERAEELIVTEVQHQQCSAHETSALQEDKADLLSMAALVARLGREQSYHVSAELLKRASAVLATLADSRTTRRHRGCGTDCDLPAGHLGDHVPPEEPECAPGPIEPEPPDYIVQCRCGWMGNVSALKSLPEFKRGCPECSVEFVKIYATQSLPVKASETPTQEWIDRSQGLTGLQYDESGERLPEKATAEPSQSRFFTVSNPPE